MKAVKISVLIMVIALIAFFVIKSIISLNSVKQISSPNNQSTVLIIEGEIDSLVKLPDDSFCKSAYENIMYDIDEGYKPSPPQHPYGYLGNTQSENDQQKENLTKRLYFAYADKFIRQAFYVFRGSEWKIEDLSFIRSECQRLKNSALLEKTNKSIVYNRFGEIETILSKYNEIAGFISSCKNFPYPATGLDDHFPIQDVQAKISRATSYQNNHMENEYVNKCERLRKGLQEIPQDLFDAHVNYLDNKIKSWLGKYSDPAYGFTSQADYARALHQPIENDIDLLDNNIYHVANLESEKGRLSKKWNDENLRAYDYQYNKR